MSRSDNIIKESMLIFIALISSTHSDFLHAQETQKCYGIVKAGMNDCATNTQSCAGSSTQDKQPDAFIFLPKGTCNKIVGSSTKSIDTKQKRTTPQ